MINYLLVVLLAIHAISAFPTVTPDSDSLIKEVLQDFPTISVTALVKKHLEDDPEFQAAVAYLQRNEFKSIIKNLHDYPDWAEFKTYLKTIGFDLDSLIHCATKTVEGIKINQSEIEGITPNLSNFLLDAKNELGTSLIRFALSLGAKAKTDTRLKTMYEKISSKETKEMVTKIIASEQVQKLFESLNKLGIHVEADLDFVFSILQWKSK